LADRTVAAPTPSAAVVETASPKNVTGTYKGLVEDSVAGSGEITFTLSQSGDDVSGTFSSICVGPRSSYTNSGSIAGTVDGDSLRVTASPSVSRTCPFSATAVITKGGAEISGTYATFGCKISASGTIQVDKED